MTIFYPSNLPAPSRGGFKANTVSPFVRTPMQSGRAKVRRTYSKVPQIWGATWNFNESQAMAFEAWFRDVLLDGTQWFECRMQTPMGLMEYTARFVSMYSGPSLFGVDMWAISADLELNERAIVAAPLGEFPDFIIYAEVIDQAINGTFV